MASSTESSSSCLVDYLQRIDLLRNIGVIAGAYKLDNLNVLDDAAKDTLTGAVESDWFWALGSGLTLDQTDQQPGEVIN